MMSDNYRRLDDLMRRELDAVERLGAVLEEEQGVLKVRDVEGMQRVVAEKQALVAQLEVYAREREGLLKRAGFSADKAGFAAFLANAGALAAPLDGLWCRLRETLKSCQAQNLVNGQILEANRRRAQDSLAILLGKPAEQRTGTYNRNGYSSMSLGGRTFAKA